MRVNEDNLNPSKINLMQKFLTIISKDDPHNVYLISKENYKIVSKQFIGENLTFLQNYNMFPDSVGLSTNLVLSLSEKTDNEIEIKIIRIKNPVFIISPHKTQKNQKCFNYISGCQMIELALVQTKGGSDSEIIKKIPFYFVKKGFNVPLPIYQNENFHFPFIGGKAIVHMSE